MLKPILPVALIIGLMAGLMAQLAAQTPAQAPNQKKTLTEKLAKLIEPWPDAAAMQARRTDAENRALFRSVEPLPVTLEADFAVINKDRDPESTKKYPATMKTGEKSVPVNLSARGHVRRMTQTCSWVPLRVEFAKAAVLGTAFEGPGALKLVTHCLNSKDHEQFILREYLAYQLSNVLTPKSFRARLARVTYVDSKTQKVLATRYGMFLEDEDDVAKRMEGRKVSLERTMFTDLEPEALAQMMVFQTMVGNTDYSIFALHNVILVQTPPRVLHPVAYDFDLSGFVHAPYARPAPNLGIASVLERAYRGPCLSEGQLAPTFAAFKGKKAAMLATFDKIPDLDADVRREIRNYLDDFFSTLDRPTAVKRMFINGCKRTTM